MYSVSYINGIGIGINGIGIIYVTERIITYQYILYYPNDIWYMIKKSLALLYSCHTNIQILTIVVAMGKTFVWKMTLLTWKNKTKIYKEKIIIYILK